MMHVVVNIDLKWTAQPCSIALKLLENKNAKRVTNEMHWTNKKKIYINRSGAAHARKRT